MSEETTTTETVSHPDTVVTDEERQELELMLEAGVHFGHKRSMWNPSMAPYVHTIRRNVFIIDVRKTEELLRDALQVIEDIVAQEGNVLIVGTQPAAKAATRSFAEELSLPFVTERWIGGTFTNFATISKRTAHLRDLESKTESGELGKYTKLEQLKFSEEIERLNRKVGGIKNMLKLPQLLVVLNIVEDEIAVREAHRSKIPIIGLVDTNGNPSSITHPIPANDDVASSVEYILNRFRSSIESGRKRAEKEAIARAKREEKANIAKAKKEEASVVTDQQATDVE